jgi:hypothetical protein
MLTDSAMASTTIPHPWRQYEHPNGDIYYYNPQLQLLTPEDIRNPDILEYIMEAREDHLQCLDGDPNRHILPPDYELVVSDVSENAAVIRMYSRGAGAAYDWTEEKGIWFSFFYSFYFSLDKLISEVRFSPFPLLCFAFCRPCYQDQGTVLVSRCRISHTPFILAAQHGERICRVY